MLFLFLSLFLFLILILMWLPFGVVLVHDTYLVIYGGGVLGFSSFGFFLSEYFPDALDLIKDEIPQDYLGYIDFVFSQPAWMVTAIFAIIPTAVFVYLRSRPKRDAVADLERTFGVKRKAKK